MEQNEAKVIVRRIKANKRKENRAGTWEGDEAGGNDISKTHVNLLVPRGSASVTTWRAIV